MEEYYLGWIEQVGKALSKWGIVRVDVKPRLVVVSGMGGSGVVGDYLQVLASYREGVPPVVVVKSHVLPRYVSRDDLVFVISYSGNTLETLKAFSEALKRTENIVVVTSNGVLAREALEKKLALIEVTKGIAPRTALPEMLISILGVLESSGIPIVSKNDVSNLKAFLEDNMGSIVNKAYSLALEIYGERKNMVIATHSPLEVLAIRGKNEFNENSKIPVKVEVAPEWAHNDIVGWEDPFTKDWFVLTLVDPDNGVGVKIVDFMKKIYMGKGFKTVDLVLKGSNILEKLFYGSLVLGLASVRLARLRGLDPMATESIKMYKSVVRDILEA